MTVELIRTYALHASSVPPEQRDALWQAARAAAADFARQNPQHPRAIMVQLQDALTLLAQGELGRQEHEAGALSAADLEPVRQVLRESARMLEELEARLTKEIPLRRRVEVAADELTADELFSLQLHIEHQLARSYRDQALLYAPQSADRVALLLKAVETLNKPLAQTPAEDPLAMQLQLDLAICQRFLGNLPQAGQLLTALDKEGIPPAVRSRARAEVLRLNIASGNLPAAEALLKNGPAGGEAAAEFDFAAFETYVALWRAAVNAQDEASSKAWQQKAVAAAQLMESTYGAYWGRRADQLLVHALPRGAGGANIELLSRTADQFYLKKDFDQALAAYDKAAEQARAAGSSDVAFEVSYKAALVEQKRSKHAAAAERFRALALSNKAHPQAAEAHLLAAWNQGKHAGQSVGTDKQYLALLAEHIDVWPAGPSAAHARFSLGKLHESRQEWLAAVNAFRGVPRDSPQYAVAIASLARCWRQFLSAEESAGKNVADSASEAATFFQQAILGPDNRVPERWSDTERLAALTSAEILLDFVPGREADAEGILKTALEASPDAPAAWKSAAQTRLVVSLAAQGSRQVEAQQMLQSVANAAPQKLLEMLVALSSVAQRSRKEVRSGIAAVQLQAVDFLTPQRQQLDKNSLLLLDRVRAEALAAAGKRDEATAAYEQLAAANPNSGPILEGYAELLLSADDVPSLKQALDQWRSIAVKSKQRTQRWYRAKYSVALAQFRLGDKAGAATLARYLLEVPPGLDGTEWKQPFVDLLKQCER